MNATPFDPYNMSTTNTGQQRRTLVEQLREKGVLHSDALTQALLTVPRNIFVPSFYMDDDGREATGPRRRGRDRWHKVAATDPDTAELYQRHLYQDQPLMTLIDERGMPISSSSMPSVMVQMIEALDLQHTHHVLEIGTGTGYNAALLASLAASCTTIDVEPSCVAHLRVIIEKFQIPNLHTFTADGIHGYPATRLYDRILVTASTPTIPRAWLDQLAPGGRLVCDFAGGLEHAFLILTKREDGLDLRSEIRPEVLGFMPLYGETLPDLLRGRIPTYPVISLDQTRREEVAHVIVPLTVALQYNRSFRWLLQTALPGIKLQLLSKDGRDVLMLTAPQRNALISIVPGSDDNATPWQVTVTARDATHDETAALAFLDRILSLYEQWQTMGEPPVEAYRVELLVTGKPVFMLGEQIFPMLTLD